MIEILQATVDDAHFVAWTVLTALDLGDENIARAEIACADEKSMYSWRNSLIAKIDGKCVGCLISYDGANYRQLRKYTWPKIWGDTDCSYIDDIADETKAGECYLDSMAILPEYRGNNIGRLLIERAIEIGTHLGYTRFTLIVDKAKPHLKLYYQSIGFEEFGEMEFFGHQYKKMKYEIK